MSHMKQLSSGLIYTPLSITGSDGGLISMFKITMDPSFAHPTCRKQQDHVFKILYYTRHCQHAFSVRVIFEEAVTRITDEDHKGVVTYGDFAKPFDSVAHRFLLAKIKSIGLGDVVVRWIEACLPGLVSRVHAGGELSGTITMRCDVLHGSVIGPTLFS